MVMRVWRVSSLSVALFLVRVSAVEASIRKLEECRRVEEAGSDKQVKHKSAYQIFRRRSQLEWHAGIPRASAGFCVW